MRGRKRSMLIAGILIVAGIVIAGTALAAVGFDFSKLSLASYVTNTYAAEGAFRSITVNGDTEDLTFVPAEDGVCRVVCHEREDEPHRVTVADGTLTIEKANGLNWHFFDFGFLKEGPSVTVYLPEKAYQALSIRMDTGDVKLPADFSFDSADIHLSTGDVECAASVAGQLTVRTSTGQIRLSDLAAAGISLTTSTGGIRGANVQCQGSVEIKVSTGSTTLENVTCGSLQSTGSTGGMTLKGVTASGAITLRRSTGSIRFDGCDAAELTVTTDTGSVKGTLLTDKIFQAHSDTGRVSVPKTTTGGRCEVNTDTGSIELEVLAQ